MAWVPSWLALPKKRPSPPAEFTNLLANRPVKHGADDATDTVYSHHVQGIVITQLRFGQDRQIADDTGDQADENGGHGAT